MPRAPSAPALPTLAPPRASDERCGGSRPAGAAGSGRARWSRLRDLIRSLVGDRISRGTAQTTGRVTELRTRRRRSLLALNLAAREVAFSGPSAGSGALAHRHHRDGLYHIFGLYYIIGLHCIPQARPDRFFGPTFKGPAPRRPARSIGTAALMGRP